MKRIFKVFITVLIFLTILCVFQAGVEMHIAYPKYADYVNNPKEEYDALFLGTSHVLNGVFPVQLWNDYGIKSYNLAFDCQTLDVSYWQLKLAKKENLNFAFIDIFFIPDDKKCGNSWLRMYLDELPFSIKKVMAINDLANKEDKAELIFPFVKFHEKWRIISVKSVVKDFMDYKVFKLSGEPSKGADLRIAVKCPESFPEVNIREYDGKESRGIEYARKIISYCRKNNIEPVFMLIPYSRQEDLKEWKNVFEKILEEENVTFLDMSDIVDFDIDQYDQDSHLNPSGARKVTECIGKYLSEQKNVKSHKNEPSAEKWNEDYIKYRKFYDEKICEQKEIKNILMLLNHSDYISEIKVCGNNEFDETEQKLIAQLGKNCTMAKSEEKSNFAYSIKVYDKFTNELICEKNFNCK